MPQAVQVAGEQQHGMAQTRKGQGRFAAGVSAADDNGGIRCFHDVFTVRIPKETPSEFVSAVFLTRPRLSHKVCASKEQAPTFLPQDRCMQIDRRTAVLLFAVVILFWGLNWPVVKLLVRHMPPLWSASMRCLIAAFTVLAVQCATRNFVIPRKQDIPIILVIGVLNMAVGPALMAVGLQYIPAGRSAVLGYTSPLWVAPGAWFFLHESLSVRKIAGIAAGMVGVAVLCNPFAADFGNSDILLGHALLLLNAFTWAAAILCIRAHVWYSTPFQLIFWQTLLAACLTAVAAFILEGPPSFTVTPMLVMLLAYCGIPATALAFWAMTVINASLPAVTTSLGVLLAPVVGIIGSSVFLGEGVDLPLIVATCLIIGGIALGAMERNRQQDARAA
jgi:drug/metabolite transporter (DMT)-like permease